MNGPEASLAVKAWWASRDAWGGGTRCEALATDILEVGGLWACTLQ